MFLWNPLSIVDFPLPCSMKPEGIFCWGILWRFHFRAMEGLGVCCEGYGIGWLSSGSKRGSGVTLQSDGKWKRMHHFAEAYGTMGQICTNLQPGQTHRVPSFSICELVYQHPTGACGSSPCADVDPPMLLRCDDPGELWRRGRGAEWGTIGKICGVFHILSHRPSGFYGQPGQPVLWLHGSSWYILHHWMRDNEKIWSPEIGRSLEPPWNDGKPWILLSRCFGVPKSLVLLSCLIRDDESKQPSVHLQ